MSNYEDLRDKYLNSQPAAILRIDYGKEVYLRKGYDTTLLLDVTTCGSEYPTFILSGDVPVALLDAFIEEYSI